METLQQRWEAARRLIEHEDTLSNHRLTWLLTLQGFLFASLTLGASTLASGGNVWYHGPVVFFLAFVIAAGVVSPLLLIRPLTAARRQIAAVRLWWEGVGRLADADWAAKAPAHKYPPIIGPGNNEFAYTDCGLDEARIDRDLPWSTYWHLPKFLVGIWACVLIVWAWLFVQFQRPPAGGGSNVSILQDRPIDKVNIDFKP